MGTIKGEFCKRKREKSILARFGGVLQNLRLCYWRNLTSANETCCLCLRVHSESVGREGNSSVTQSPHTAGLQTGAGDTNLDLKAVSRCSRQTKSRPDQVPSITERQLRKHGRGFAVLQVFLMGMGYLEHLKQNKNKPPKTHTQKKVYKHQYPPC